MDNAIEDTSASSLGSLLFKTKIKELNLAGNSLSNEGLTLIFDTLRTKNRSLEILDVSDNTISIGLLHPLRALVEKNTILEELFISSVHRFTTEAQSKIAESLVINKGLRIFHLGKTTKDCYWEIEKCNV